MPHKFFIALSVILAALLAYGGFYTYQFFTADNEKTSANVSISETNTNADGVLSNLTTSSISNNPDNNSNVVSSTKKIFSVSDYFLRLPNKYLDDFFGEMTLETRKQKLTSVQAVHDEKNYYLSFKSEIPAGRLGSADYWTMTVFNTPTDEQLVVIDHTIQVETALQELYFLKYDNGRWTDVTEPIFGEIYNQIKNLELRIAAQLHEFLPNEDADFALENTKFLLPRKGTTIKFGHGFGQEIDILLYNIYWKNGKFILEY